MTTKTLRLSDSQSEAIRDLGTSEYIEEFTDMRKLLRLGYEVYLAEQYRTGRRTLRDIAGHLELSQSEALDVMQRLGITGNASADDTLASFRSLKGNASEGCPA